MTRGWEEWEKNAPNHLKWMLDGACSYWDSQGKDAPYHPGYGWALPTVRHNEPPLDFLHLMENKIYHSAKYWGKGLVDEPGNVSYHPYFPPKFLPFRKVERAFKDAQVSYWISTDLLDGITYMSDPFLEVIRFQHYASPMVHGDWWGHLYRGKRHETEYTMYSIFSLTLKYFEALFGVPFHFPTILEHRADLWGGWDATHLTCEDMENLSGQALEQSGILQNWKRLVTDEYCLPLLQDRNSSFLRYCFWDAGAPGATGDYIVHIPFRKKDTDARPTGGLRLVTQF